MGASGALDQVLLELGIDLSPVETAGEKIRSVLTTLNQYSDRVKASTASTGEQQKRQLEEVKFLAQAMVELAARQVGAEKVKLAELRSGTEAYRQQKAEASALNEMAKAGVLAEQHKLSVIRSQTAAIQQQIAQQRLSASRGGGGGGGASRILGSLGMGGAGGLMGAVAGGNLIATGIESAVSGVENFIEKLKQVTIESGKLVQVKDLFERVAKAAGIDAGDMLQKMRVSTEGVVAKLDLMKIATAAMQSPLKLTTAQITQLTGDVVKLAEAHGMSIDRAVSMLERGFQRGRIEMVAMAAGLPMLAVRLDRTAQGLGRVGKAAEQGAHAISVIHQEAEKLGDIPLTIQHVMEQFSIARAGSKLEFGVAINQSAGMQVALHTISELIMSLGSAGSMAEKVGKKIGDVFAVVAETIRSLLPVAQQLFKVFFDVVELGTRMKGAVDGTNAIATAGNTAVDAFKTLHPIMYQVLSTVLLLNEEIKDFLEQLDRYVNKAKGVVDNPVVKLFGQGLKATVSGMTGGLSNLPGLFGSFSHGTEGESQKLTPEERAAKQMQAFVEQYAKMEAMLAKPRPGITKPAFSETISPALAIREAQARMQAEIALAKDRLAARKADIEEEKYLDTERYRKAEESLTQHLATQKMLSDQSRSAQRQENQKVYESQLKEETEAYKTKAEPYGGAVPKEVSETHQLKIQQLTEQYHTKNIEAERQYQHQINTIDKEGYAAQLADARKAITQMETEEQDSIKRQQELNEKRFGKGETSPQEYFSKQIALTEALAESQIRAAQATYEASVKYGAGVEAAQTRQLAMTKALDAAVKVLGDTYEAAGQKQYQQIQKQLQPQQKALESQLEYQKSTGGAPSSQLAIMQQMVDATVRERQALEALMNSGAVPQLSELWHQILQRVEQTYDSQLKLNAQIDAMRDKAAPIGAAFAGIANTIGENFKSKFAQNLAQMVGAGSKGLEQATAAGQQIGKDFGLRGGDTEVKKDLQTLAAEKIAESTQKNVLTPVDKLSATLDKTEATIRDLISQLQGKNGAPPPAVVVPVEGQNVTEGAQQGQTQPIGINTGSASQRVEVASSGSGTGTGGGAGATDPLSQWTQGLVHSLAAITSFTSSILNAKSALGGAAGGAMGGAGLGKTASSALGIAGPWGELAGAVGGGILGGIVGEKNAKVTANIHSFEDDYKQIMNQFALNTNNLNNTIIALQGLVNQVAQMQAKSKKGSSQYQQLIDQYNQEIMQLEQQQNQILVNMREMSAIASAPVGAQSALQGIQSIIQQYEQYAGAIQSVQQLEAQGMDQQQAQAEVLQQQATAYQYLTDAIQTYETNLQNQLLQDQTQAINDAIQLQDLLYQQQQDMLNYNNQVQSLLSQGVLTRQMTRAQSAGQQIEQLSVQYQMQMDALNEQISAEQYKVAAESQIFNLAQTRIGLENQLLAAQNAQTSYSMQQIAALQALVTQIQTGNIQTGPLGQLLGAIPTVTNGSTTMTPLQILLGLFGLSVNPNGTLTVSPSGPSGGGGGGTVVGNGAGGTALFDGMISDAYQSRASMGFAQFRGTNL